MELYFLVEPDTTVVPVDVGGMGSLEALQALVGGLVDVVAPEAGLDVWCLDDMAGAELNPLGSLLASSTYGVTIAGPCVVAAGCDEEGETVAFNDVEEFFAKTGSMLLTPVHTVADVEASREAGNFWHPEGVR